MRGRLERTVRREGTREESSPAPLPKTEAQETGRALNAYRAA
jgi:hypothetical protein